MKEYLTLLVMTLALNATAFAGQKKGGICTSLTYKNASSIFNCEYIGQVTISQIYDQGWKVVSSFSQPWHGQYFTTLIIEQQS